MREKEGTGKFHVVATELVLAGNQRTKQTAPKRGGGTVATLGKLQSAVACQDQKNEPHAKLELQHSGLEDPNSAQPFSELGLESPGRTVRLGLKGAGW